MTRQRLLIVDNVHIVEHGHIVLIGGDDCIAQRHSDYHLTVRRAIEVKARIHLVPARDQGEVYRLPRCRHPGRVFVGGAVVTGALATPACVKATVAVLAVGETTRVSHIPARACPEMPQMII